MMNTLHHGNRTALFHYCPRQELNSFLCHYPSFPLNDLCINRIPELKLTIKFKTECPSCPKRTPAIALSVVPKLISYILLYTVSDKRYLNVSGLNNLKKRCNGKIRSALFWDITKYVVVFPYRRFEASYLSHLQSSRNTKIKSI
jgi:hypothetical protein